MATLSTAKIMHSLLIGKSQVPGIEKVDIKNPAMKQLVSAYTFVTQIVSKQIKLQHNYEQPLNYIENSINASMGLARTPQAKELLMSVQDAQKRAEELRVISNKITQEFEESVQSLNETIKNTFPILSANPMAVTDQSPVTLPAIQERKKLQALSDKCKQEIERKEMSVEDTVKRLSDSYHRQVGLPTTIDIFRTTSSTIPTQGA